MKRAQRLVALLAPFAAVAGVFAGLRAGAPRVVQAAVLYGAAAPAQSETVAWQVFAFRDDGRESWPLAATHLSILSLDGDRAPVWMGETNRDGIAEARFALPGPARLEVRAGDAVLARGGVVPLSPAVGSPPALPSSLLPSLSPPPAPPLLSPPPDRAWAPFARRSGRVALRAAVLGQRLAPGFRSMLCVQATDAETGAPLSGVEIRADDDPSLVVGGVSGPTDSEGWTELTLGSAGLAASLTLRARELSPRAGAGSRGAEAPRLERLRAAPGSPSEPAARVGEWVGGLWVSPGAAGVETRARWSPAEEPEIRVIAPVARALEYLEIDGGGGRAWAASVPLSSRDGALPSAAVRVPRLPPGLYWAIAAGDPIGASELGPATSVRPFFVAASDEAALAFGADREACAPRAARGEPPRPLWPCLSLAVAQPVMRRAVLDGTLLQRAIGRARRRRGIGIAVGAVALSALLECVLLLRAASRSRPAQELERNGRRGSALRAGWALLAALLVALLGFALLAVFVDRAG